MEKPFFELTIDLVSLRFHRIVEITIADEINKRNLRNGSLEPLFHFLKQKECRIKTLRLGIAWDEANFDKLLKTLKENNSVRKIILYVSETYQNGLCIHSDLSSQNEKKIKSIKTLLKITVKRTPIRLLDDPMKPRALSNYFYSFFSFDEW